MGLILDSSFIIAGERRGRTALQILQDIRATQGEIDVGISVVTIAELTHGAYRSKTDNDRLRRLSFIEELCRDVPIHPITLEIGKDIGRIEGQRGTRDIPLLRRLGYRSDRPAPWIRCRHAQYPALSENPRAEDRLSPLVIGAFLDVRLFWEVFIISP